MGELKSCSRPRSSWSTWSSRASARGRANDGRRRWQGEKPATAATTPGAPAASAAPPARRPSAPADPFFDQPYTAEASAERAAGLGHPSARARPLGQHQAQAQGGSPVQGARAEHRAGVLNACLFQTK
jgi:hypothetical protein